MKMTTSNFAILLGGCLALTASSFAPIAQSQSSARSIQRSALASMQTRSDFATRIENQLRQRGMDARVQLDGDARDLLRIESQSLGHSDVYSFVNSLSAKHAKQIGLTGIIFSNNKQRWDYDLARESMIWSPAQP